MMTGDKKTAQSLKQIVYEDLKHQIITCELLPGAQITEEALCERLKASRTPVRDAIGRLEQEQLVTIRPKKGIIVNTVSLSSVSELFEARLRIEPYAVEHYGNRIGDDVYAEFVACFNAPRDRGMEQYFRDDEFHRMFVDATKNRYLIRFYSTVKDQVMRYRVLSALDARLAETNREHLAVVGQCLRGNWRQAAEAMRAHIENSKIAILDYVMKQNRDARNIFGSSRKVVGFKPSNRQGEKANEGEEILIVPIAVANALSHLDFVVEALQLACADRKNGMSGKTVQT